MSVLHKIQGMEHFISITYQEEVYFILPEEIQTADQFVDWIRRQNEEQ